MGEATVPSSSGLAWGGNIGASSNTSFWTPPQLREVSQENLPRSQHASAFEEHVPDSYSTARYLTSRFLLALAIWAGSHAAQTLRRDATAASPSSRPRFPSETAPRIGCWLLLSAGFFFIGLFSLGQACLSSILSLAYGGRRKIQLAARLLSGPSSSSSRGAGGPDTSYRLTIFKRDSQEVLDLAMEFWEREVGRALVGPHRADASVLLLVPLSFNWFFLAWPRAVFRSEAGYESFLREALDFWEDRLPLMLRGPQRRPEAKSD
ncbi:hypothetical protein CPLU01_08948 [Colletotrichum plurivorum]|uniref:Uncharacterized protein n=1 Tax=Colletotrichum plurivorum TaxID=2175906 RepID=A0A8H6KAP0_9PEZI|nr:hypothetical protein CPLU01_08948 [Colletotrichum plurivorum]